MQTNRIETIDMLRGLVIMLMTIDHVREFFFVSHPLTDPMDLRTTSPFLFLSRYLAHFCAPIFVFLAGISAYLYGQKRTKQETSLFLLKRGLFLIALEVTVINFAWTFSLMPAMIYLQVIWAIGWSMIFLSLIIWLPRVAILFSAIAFFAGHHLLSGFSFDGEWSRVLWAIFYKRDILPLTDLTNARTSYPILPWIGIMALGYVYGTIFTKEFSVVKRRSILIYSAMGSFFLFCLLRFSNLYGEHNLFIIFPNDIAKTIMSFFNLTKYPPSFLFSMMVLGGGFFGLNYFEGKKGKIQNILLSFGRVPMFYYIVHLYFVHILYKAVCVFMGNSYNLPHATLIWVLTMITLIVLYPLMVWFGKIKSKTQIKFLKYL